MLVDVTASVQAAAAISCFFIMVFLVIFQVLIQAQDALCMRHEMTVADFDFAYSMMIAKLEPSGNVVGSIRSQECHSLPAHCL